MDWDADLSNEAKEIMKFLGNFGPTNSEAAKTVKGYMHDDEGGSKVYLDAAELRQIASACNEVADWLDRRASQAVLDTKCSFPEVCPEHAHKVPQKGCLRCNTPQKCAIWGCCPGTWEAETIEGETK